MRPSVDSPNGYPSKLVTCGLDDVEAIAEYINRDSPAYTQAVVNKIVDTSRKLAEFPDAGRIVPELGDKTIRERFVYSYRLIYRFRGNDVLVVAVVHGRRLLEPLLAQISET